MAFDHLINIETGKGLPLLCRRCVLFVDKKRGRAFAPGGLAAPGFGWCPLPLGKERARRDHRSSRSSGEKGTFGPASRSGVLGSGGLAPPSSLEGRDSVPAPVKLDDDARSHPGSREDRCPRLPFTHRTHHGPGANSGPRGQLDPHGHRHCPPDGKRPSHHPVLPPPLDRSRVRSRSGAVRGRINPRGARGITSRDFLGFVSGVNGFEAGVKVN